MISERRLVSSHSSFWRNAMPLGDSFVRFMNSSLERFDVPVNPPKKGSRNSLISELSFRLYENYILVGEDLFSSRVNSPKVLQFADEVIRYISKMDRNLSAVDMSDVEIAEAKLWARALHRFEKYVCPGQRVIARPAFEGCGIIDPCSGDLLIGTTLWELKNVERDFRLADLRQLLAYCALNYASQQFDIKEVGLVNARHGVYFQVSLTSLALMSSAMTEGELLGEIVRYVTADAPSR
jgi:hypothetical protein